MKNVSASLANLVGGAKWRGHFDGIRADGSLHGWAFLAEDPEAVLELQLYVHGIHLASTRTGLSRVDIDRLLHRATPAQTGFCFLPSDVLPEGALTLMRQFGRSIPPANLRDDVRICIAGSTDSLPGAASHVNHVLDLGSHLPALIKAAGGALRAQIQGKTPVPHLDYLDQEIILSANPLFCADWYSRTYGEVALSQLDPAQHYVRFSSILDRPPSPWFDNAEYLRSLPKSQEPNLPAVVHYDLHGHDYWWPGQGRFRSIDREDAGNNDFALLIHLYHLDTVPDLQLLIDSFPADVDVFITIPENSPGHDPDDIAMLFPRATGVMTVPNLGQDVAAFLEAVRRLKGRGYRFFCKAHSKKGNKYPEIWRRTMFDALAATPERVERIARLFRSDERVLMAGPQQFWFDGTDWLNASGPRLLEFTDMLDLGQGILSQKWGFFAGTCFWIDARLAEIIADVVPTNAFHEATVATDGQTAHAVERLFSLVAQALGGRIALVDGRDWTSDPVIADGSLSTGPRRGFDETKFDFIIRALRQPQMPQIVEGTAATASAKPGFGPFGDADCALHGDIDVMISCWNAQPEPLHKGLAELDRQLNAAGLTSAALVASRDIAHVFYGTSCMNVASDTSLLSLPVDRPSDLEPSPKSQLDNTIAKSLLRSECLFLKSEMPEGVQLQKELQRIRLVHAYWKRVLVRHKVKTFLIWGSTAPKSRLFIRLCQELRIEYQIIERGHFPGTLSIDPMGQFGTSVHPRLVGHASEVALPGDLESRFEEIRSWYAGQQDNAAYARFQKRGTRDLDIMAQAKAQGRPVILVIGGNDQGGGVVLPDADPLRVNWFGTSDQAFTMIRSVVSSKFPDALLVLRPHPSQQTQSAEFVLVARETAMDDLVDAADICITIATTASAVCLLKDKPLLTLGLSELNGRGVGVSITDETHLLAALRKHIWSGFAAAYPDQANRRFIIELFDRHLIGVDKTVPTRHRVDHLASLLAGRIHRMKTGFLQDHDGREHQISKALYEDVRDRGRAIFPVDRLKFAGRTRPAISVVLPIYGDYEGTRLCFELLARHQAENGYRVITVWDRGPDLRLRDLCMEFAERAGFTYLENRENVGFSGTVNSGILHAGRDDVILLNSDTVPCGNWALRLQDAAYAHPKVAAVVPFSNSATIYNVPFPSGQPLPDADPVQWVNQCDLRAQMQRPQVLEMPISHGFCTYVRRTTFDRLGLFSESKFDKGHGEDNEFSMRIRASGGFCGCAAQVFIGHAGSTSFAEDAMKWKLAGRKAMSDEFSHYQNEIEEFFRTDPFAKVRKVIEQPQDVSEPLDAWENATRYVSQMQEV